MLSDNRAGPEGANLHQRDEFDAGTWLAIWSLTPDSIKLAEVLKVLAHALRLVQLPPLISPSAAKARRQLEVRQLWQWAIPFYTG